MVHVKLKAIGHSAVQTMLWRVLPHWIYRRIRDDCEVCLGSRGGVWGNENIVMVAGEPVVMCDYCAYRHQHQARVVRPSH